MTSSNHKKAKKISRVRKDERKVIYTTVSFDNIVDDYNAQNTSREL